MAIPNALHGMEKTGIPQPNLNEPVLGTFLLSLMMSFFLAAVVLAVRSNEVSEHCAQS